MLHKLHNDYPLASQKRETDDDILSNMGSISQYIFHYKNLQLYV